MYTEDFVFGPFTARQSVCLIVGLGIASALSTYEGGKHVYGIAGTIVACAVVGAFRLSPEYIPLERLAEYLQRKKLAMGEAAFERFAQRKIAEAQSQIEIRKMRGLPLDPALEQVAKIFEGVSVR
jgi:hypothetical protein